jgi:hypothetical protein
MPIEPPSAGPSVRVRARPRHEIPATFVEGETTYELVSGPLTRKRFESTVPFEDGTLTAVLEPLSWNVIRLA